MKLEDAKQWVTEFFRSPWKTLLLLVVLLVIIVVVVYASTYAGEKAKQHASPTASTSNAAPVAAPPKRGEFIFIKNSGGGRVKATSNTVHMSGAVDQTMVQNTGTGSVEIIDGEYHLKGR